MKKVYCIIAFTIALCAFTPFVKAQSNVKGNTGAGWQEKSGLAYNKSISEPTTEGIYTITLESFTTGKVTVTHESIPADIVLVLDCSGSMTYTMSGGTANDNSSDQTKWSKKKVLINAVTTFVNAIFENDTVDPETHQARTTALGNRVSIITFAAHGSSRTRVSLANGAVTTGTGTTQDPFKINTTITNAISTYINASGQTWADEGMDKAYTEVNSCADTRKRRTVVLFTDGLPGNGTSFTSTSNHGGVACLTGGPNYNNSGSYNTWTCANNVINTANNIKKLSNEAKDIKSTVFTVSVVQNPDTYAKRYLEKTSSEWKDATKMATLEPYVYYGTTYYRLPQATNTGDGTRNTDGKTYAYSATTASELNKIFDTIASSSGGSAAQLDNTTVSQVDVVSASFALPAGADKNSIKVYTVRYAGDTTEGGVTKHHFDSTTVGGKKVENLIEARTRTEKYLRKWKDNQGVEHQEMTDVDDAIVWDLTPSQAGSTKKDKITVNGFDYANLWCGPDETVTSGDYAGWHQGYKIVIKIPVKMDDEAVGGPSLNTNGDGSGIYVNGVNQFPFVSPEVSLPVNIHIRKEGLEVGESAKFKIERTTDGTKWDPVTSVFVTRTDKDAKEGENAPITKIFGLPATDNSTPAKEYVYRIVEEPWSWSYVTGASTPTTTDLLEVNPFIFTNSKKANIDNKVKNGESKTFNTFLPGNTEGSYVDSKPRTTTTTTTP